MPPDGMKDACPSPSEEETMPMLTKDVGHAAVDLSSGGSTQQRRWRFKRLPVKHAVKLLVFIDMFAVAIVISLMTTYFKELNISSERYGLMSSAYSCSQIVGGLVLGALSDHAMSRRNVLIISFLGSALSYGTIGLSSSLNMLLAGRVIVGLVKQTMTMSTAIVSEHTSPEDRSAELSKLTAVMTVSHVVGPALGSLLYQRSKKFPPLVASSLFLLNTALALVLLPGNGKEVGGGSAASRKKTDGDGDDGATPALVAAAASSSSASQSAKSESVAVATAAAAAAAAAAKGKNAEAGSSSSSTASSSASGRFLQNFKKACSSGPTLRILAAMLVNGFFMRSLEPRGFVGYYEERFGVESWALGYISSYTLGLSFLVQVFVIGRLTSWTSETSLVAMSLAVVTVMKFAEGAPSMVGLVGYLALLVPARTVANSALWSCLQSIFTQRVPQGDLGAALGVLNVLQSASGVVGPLYGGKLMGSLGILALPTVTAAHYAAFSMLWWAMEVRGGGGGGGGGAAGGGGGGGVGATSFRSKKLD